MRYHVQYPHSNDTGGEVPDTVEDQLKVLREQLRAQIVGRCFAELTLARDNGWQLAEREQALWVALESQCEGQPQALRIIEELRHKMEALERLSNIGGLVRAFNVLYMRSNPQSGLRFRAQHIK